MKIIQTIFSRTILLLLGVMICSCNDLSEVNTSEDALNADRINLKYVLGSTITGGAKAYVNQNVYGGFTVSEAMQYLQRTFIDYSGPNQLIWQPMAYDDAGGFPLTNANYLLTKSENEKDPSNKVLFKASGLIFRAFWFGFISSAWGDIPYTEALQGESGNFKPKYDTQDVVFKGIIAELAQANELLSSIQTTTGMATDDVMFRGDVLKWRKFANVLRLRYLMRLSEKTDRIDGLNVAQEFKKMIDDPSTYPLFTSNADNASFAYAGATDSSFPGGNINWPNRSEFYRRKPCATFVNALREGGDPRLTLFIRPVDLQVLLRPTLPEGIGTVDGKPKRIVHSLTDPFGNKIDTSLFVGIPPALLDPNTWNYNNAVDYQAINRIDPSIYTGQAANPSVSGLADMFQQNTHPLVKVVYASYTELCFLLAEARLRGWVEGDVAEAYVEGVKASLDQYQIADGSPTVYNRTTHAIEPFDRTAFLTGLRNRFVAGADKMDLLMSQKWVALFMTAEFWFDWRRTGLPHLGKNLIAGSNGSKIPLRYIYGDNEKITNPVNVNEAVGRFPGKTDTQWQRMWLLQGSNKPYTD